MTTDKQGDAQSQPGEVALERPVGRPAPKRYPGPRRYLVADRRNSVSAIALDRLDWNRWFTDGTSRGLYLHVWSKDGETCHRVFCRHSDTPRLSCDSGKLRWLVDPQVSAANWAESMRAKLDAHLREMAGHKTPNTELTGPRSNDGN